MTTASPQEKTATANRKAQFYGHCQVCGAKQKLPNMRLSKHGYTTRFGFFSGICAGAEEMPFEQSKQLVDAAIARAKVRAVELRADAEARRASTNPDDVFRSIYPRGGSWGHRDHGSKEFHGKVEMIQCTNKGVPMFYSHDELKGQPMMTPVFVYEWQGERRTDGMNPGSLEDAVAGLNRNKAWQFDQLAKQADQYVEWQTARVANWAPVPTEKWEAVK